MTTSPPRFLTGVTLIFWGYMTEHLLVSLLAAVILEAKHWTTTRWSLSDTSYVRAWNSSILSALIIATLAWFNGLKPNEIHSIFVWIPIFLLPLELAQRYGTKDAIPLNTFSFIARKKWILDQAAGRETSTCDINTSYSYIAIALLATAMGSSRGHLHFIGLSVIIALCLLSVTKKHALRPLAWSIALTCTLALSFGGQWVVKSVIDQYAGLSFKNQPTGLSPNESRTAIGKLGKIKLSRRVFWRMQVGQAAIPDLLTTAVYNHYSRSSWKHLPPDDLTRDQDYLGPRDIDFLENTAVHIFDEEQTNYQDNPQFIKITGEIKSNLQENAIPAPANPAALLTSGKETGIETNSLGTVRITNPDFSVINYKVWQGARSNTEATPNTSHDLAIPEEEREAIQRVAQSLGLHDPSLSTAKKIQILRRHFKGQFQYTTHLRTTQHTRITKRNAVGIFLENTKAGHCEYFATATAMLLRESGVPARYCVGFAVKNKSSTTNTWRIRGTDAHAWCRAWVDDHWENVDLTPASWRSSDTGAKMQWINQFIEWWQIAREDFTLWRTNGENKSTVSTLLISSLAILPLWLLWRLWRAKKNNHAKSSARDHVLQPALPTALNQLEPIVSRQIGPRPVGTTLPQWMSTLSSLDPRIKEPLARACQLHSTIRFDPSYRTSETTHPELETKLQTELEATVKTLHTLIKENQS